MVGLLVVGLGVGRGVRGRVGWPGAFWSSVGSYVGKSVGGWVGFTGLLEGDPVGPQLGLAVGEA